MKKIVTVFLLTWLSLGCKPGDLSGSHREEELYYAQLFSLMATPDGGYLTGVIRYHSLATVTTTDDLLTPTYQYDPGSTYDDLMLVKTDASGNRQWEKVLEKPDYQRYGKVLLASSGNYLVAGTTTNKSQSKYDVILTEISPDGQERSSQQLAQSGTGMILNDLQNGPSGDLFIAGYQSKSGSMTGSHADWIARLRPDGRSTRWALSAVDSTKLPTNTTFAVAPDGNLLIASLKPVNYSSQAYFRKISPEGLVRWTLDVSTVNQLTPRQLFATADGGFLLAGSALPTSSATTRQVVLVKADANGRIQSVQWFDTGQSSYDYDHGLLSKRADGAFALATWKSNQITLTLLDTNGGFSQTIATASTLNSFSGIPVFMTLVNGDMLLVELIDKTSQAKQIMMHKIGPDGKERWQQVISSL